MTWMKKYIKAEWQDADKIVYCKDCHEQVDAEIDIDDGEIRCYICGGTDILSIEERVDGRCSECMSDENNVIPDGDCKYCGGDGTMLYGDDIEGSEPETVEDVFEAIKSVYGTTLNMNCATWLLPDGSIINGCYGGSNGRDIDHRAATAYMGKYKEGLDDSTDMMNKLIEMGAIRLKPSNVGSAIQISAAPTASQIDAVDDFFENLPGPHVIQFGFENRDYVELEEYWDAGHQLKKRYWSGYETELPAVALASRMTRSMLKYSSALPRGYFDGLSAALETMKQSFVDVASRAIRVGGDATDAAEAIEDYIYDQLTKRMGFSDVEVVESLGSARTASVTVFNPQTDDASEITLNVDMNKADRVSVDDVVHMIDTSDVLQRIASTTKRAGSGITVKKIVRQRKYKHGYVIRDEYWAFNDDDPEDTWTLVERQAYTPSGEYIGDSKTAYFLCKTKGIIPRLSSPDHCVCSVGYNPVQKKWYGWSHRAIAGFGIGDMIFESGWEGATEKTPYKKHGDKKIETMEDAMTAAIAFAASVS